MKKYNIEEQLADKLGNRSITPSDHAWERIAFGRQQQTAKNKKKHWHLVAAAVLLFCFGGYFAINTNLQNTENSTPIVFEGAEKQNTINHEAQNQEIIATADAVEVKDSNYDMITAKAIQGVKRNAETSSINKQTELPVLLSNKALENNKALAMTGTPVVNAITKSQEDLLLEKALRDVALAKPVPTQTDDSALLKEVEAEMDAYYRERALRFFSLKYKKIRIVVTDNH